MHAMQCHAPEKIGPLAVSDDGSLCCGGGVSGRLYLWEVGSGALVRSWDAHYKVYTTCCMKHAYISFGTAPV
jgi:pre-rRNA-processing protein IPI3